MNSRWSTKPIKRDGQVVSIRPNVAGDIEILKALGRYTVLTATDIAALTQRSYGAVIARLNLLKRDPNKLIQVHDTQQRQPRIFQWSPQVFHLTDKGEAVLAELGFEVADKPSSHFIHQITESQTAASFEVGARLCELEHVVLEHKPIPVTFTWRGKTYHEHKLTPDAGPIGLGYGNDIYQFVVIETDCASEPLTSSNRDRQAIELKLAAYLTILEQRLYETVYGIPNLIICFTTTSATRLDNMRELLGEMSKKYLNSFGFTLFPTILTGKQPPQGWAVKTPWTTVHGTLNLAEK